MKNRILFFALFAFAISANAQSLSDARRLNENEQHEEATSIYKLLVALEPTKGDYYYYWGNNMLDADKIDSARIIFNEGLKKEPGNFLLQIGIAELSLYNNNLAEGKTLIESTVKNAGPKNWSVMVEAARALIIYKKAQDLISARVYLDAALKLNPKNPEIYNLIGDIYSEENNGTEAAKYYNYAVEKEAKFIKSIFHKGQLYKSSGNIEGGIEEFNKVIKIDPNFAPAYRELGECYSKSRKGDLAKENFKKYLELSKNNNEARLRYIQILFFSAEFKEASNELALITKVDSTNLLMMKLMAYVNYEIGNNDTARKAIEKVFSITENDTTKRTARDYSYYGKICIKNGKDDLGAKFLESSVLINPKQPELFDIIIDIYNKQKNYELSALTYENKIKNAAKPLSADYFNLGRALYNAKNYFKADTAFIKVNELSPSWPNGYFWRGRTNSQIDQNAKESLAKSHYLKFIELAIADTANLSKQKNNLMEAYRYLALIAYYNSKDCKLSIDYWNKIIDIDSSNKEAKEFVKTIGASKDCK